MMLGIGFQIFMSDSQAHDRPLRFDIESDAGVLVLFIGFISESLSRRRKTEGVAAFNCPQPVTFLGRPL